MKVDRWMNQYIEVKSLAWAGPTLERRKQIATNNINRHLCYTDLNNLDLPQLQGWVQTISSYLAPVTVRDVVKMMDDALDMAVAYKYIEANPCDQLVLPRLEQSYVQVLDEDGAKQLIDAAYGTDLYIPVVLALTCGLRRGEILGLRWSDIKGDTLVISRTRGPQGMKETKTRSSTRSLVLPGWVAEYLAQERLDRDQECLICPLDPYSLSQRFKRLAVRCEYTNLHFHCLRHSHASILLKRGVGVKVVSKRLGHSSTRITLDTYAHVLPGMDESAAEVFDQL